jgi:hypothetical protein
VADVVCPDRTHSERAVLCTRSDHALLGVIADETSSFLVNARGGSVDATLTGQPLVLAGRVPVKVSLENGPIEIGDFLTPSSTPGVAMRLTGPGASVGIALASFDGHAGASGAVLCFVKVGEANLAVGMAELRSQNDQLRSQNDELRSQSDRLRTRLDRLENLVAALVDAPGRGRDRVGTLDALPARR